MTETTNSKNNKRLDLLSAVAFASAIVLGVGAFAPIATAHDGFPIYADLNKATKS
jgi:hypothetical protein